MMRIKDECESRNSKKKSRLLQLCDWNRRISDQTSSSGEEAAAGFRQGINYCLVPLMFRRNLENYIYLKFRFNYKWSKDRRIFYVVALSATLFVFSQIQWIIFKLYRIRENPQKTILSLFPPLGRIFEVFPRRYNLKIHLKSKLE